MKLVLNRKYRRICAAIVMTVVLISGCAGKHADKEKKTQNEDVTTGVELTEEHHSSSDASEEEERPPVADGEYRLKEFPVPNNPGLYEIKCDELSGEDAWVADMLIYEEDIIVLYETSELLNYLYRVNPLQAEVTAAAELGEGIYYEGSLTVGDDGSLTVYDYLNNELHIFDGLLNENNCIFFGDTRKAEVLISSDMRCGYYVDYDNRGIFMRDLENGDTERLFTDITAQIDGNAGIDGLIDDRWLFISYFDVEAAQSVYEVRDLETREIIYHDYTSLYDAENDGEYYILRRGEDGIDDILFGSYEGETQLLVLPYYAEYRYVSVSARDRYAVGGAAITSAEGSLNHACFSVYNLETGKREYTCNFKFTDVAFRNVAIDIIVSNGAERYAVFAIKEDTAARILVWDYLDESSRANDDTCYVREWSNLKNPDGEFMSALAERAAELGNKNGIEIYFGDAVNERTDDMYEYEANINAIRLEQALNILEEELSLYPEGMLAQLDDDYGGILKIYLSGKIRGADENALTTVTGVQSTRPDDTVIVLDITSVYDFKRSIHHEIFHAIEGYLNRTDAYFDFDRWSSYNPEGFIYDFDYMVNGENYNYDYALGDGEHGVFFVDAYSKSFPHEDRARIMEYAMTEQEYHSGLFAHEAVRQKLSYICGQIRNGFNTKGWPEVTVWEQVLE